MYLLAEIIPFIRRLRVPITRDQAILLMAAVNEIILGADIYLAHSIDGTIVPYEWIPIIFGPIAGIFLLICGLIALRNHEKAALIATVIFFLSILVGVLGSYFHWRRALLYYAPAGQQITTSLLIYGPPVLGPLTFILVAVLGLSAAWQEDPPDSGRLHLTQGKVLQMPTSKTQGYFLLIGLYILMTLVMSVLDHARNHFVNPWLWLPTVTGIFAASVTLAMGFFRKIERSDLIIYVTVMIIMALVGLTGVYFHILHNLNGQGTFVGERFLKGAPMMAPLLFANMALFGLLILFDPVPIKRVEPPNGGHERKPD
jgi:hypothetical protein